MSLSPTPQKKSFGFTSYSTSSLLFFILTYQLLFTAIIKARYVFPRTQLSMVAPNISTFIFILFDKPFLKIILL
jgi:hypothetical protein